MINFKRFLNLIKKLDFLNSTWLILLSILEAIIPGIVVIILAQIMQTVTSNAWKQTLNLVVAVSLLQLIRGVSGETKNYIRVKMMSKVRRGILNEYLQKLREVKVELMENQKVIDLRDRVFDKPDEKIVLGFSSVLNILSIFVSILFIIVVLSKYNPLLGLFVLLLDFPIIIMAYKNGKRNYIENKKATYHRRYYNYLEKIQYEKETVAEQKIFNSFDLINCRWKEENEKARKLEMQAFLKYFLGMRSGSFVVSFVFFALLIVLAKCFNVGEKNLFISLMGYLISVFQIQTDSLPFSLSSFAKTLEFVRDEAEYMALENRVVESNECDINRALEHVMEFKNVSFRYPNTDKDVIQNISFKLRLNGHYAFVGSNGSGKSTIMKLIAGLYSDYRGEILLDGIELRKYSPKMLREYFSVIFQRYTKYPLSIYDNIAISGIEKEGNNAEIHSVIESVGIKEAIAEKPRGLDTLMWRSDKGYSDFSEGQWQRLAMARCLFSNSIMRIMDEPTASIDPSQEKNFFDDYSNLSKNTGTILISHRLASVKNADTIFVINAGRLIESGSHYELMNNKEGLYYTMFKEQEKWYVL